MEHIYCLFMKNTHRLLSMEIVCTSFSNFVRRTFNAWDPVYADVAAFNPNQNFSTQHTHTLLLFNQLWRSFYFVWFLISDAHSRPVTMCVPVQVCSIPTGYGCRWLLQININNNINIVVPCWFNLLVRLCVCAPSTGERILVAAAFHLLQFQLWIALVVRQRQRLRRWPCHNIIIFYLFTGELKVVENDTAP